MSRQTAYGFIFSFTVNVIAESLAQEYQLCPNSYHVIEKNDITWSEASQLYSYFLPELNKHCATISVTGVHQAWFCSNTTRWYLCQLPPAACVGDDLLERDECYRVYSDAGNCVLRCHNQTRWHEARNLCLDKGGDLISLEDDRLASHVMSRIERDMGDTQEVMWIGLTSKPWAWNLITYNQTITYSHWDIEQPKEDTKIKCLAVGSIGQQVRWQALDCDVTLQAALCQANGNGSDSKGKPFPSNRTEVNDRRSTADWLSNDRTVVLLSVSASVVFVLLVIVIILIVCLRNARRINVMLGSRPKTYFDYFDFGFRRKLPPLTLSSEHNRTVVLTNSMLSPAISKRDDNRDNEAYV